jgi:S1-C subfamily serine protease
MRPQFEGSPFGDERFKDFFGKQMPPQERRQGGVGTGFIIDKSGHIITNNHVVEDADKIKVEKEGEYGLQATDLTPEMAQRSNTQRETGVVVVGVRPESKAAKAGVQQGDLIVEVNRQNVSSTGELKQLLAKSKGDGGISLLVQRSNAGMLVLKMA